MKKCIIILIYIFILLFTVNPVWADGNILGAGIILGEPTGICVKLWLGKVMALDAAFAWSFKKDYFLIHADYLFHFLDPFKIPKGHIAFYAGIGGKVILADQLKAGVRVPLGITYIFEKIPLDIFLEIAPTLELIPETDFSFDGAIGVRYYFIRSKGNLEK